MREEMIITEADLKSRFQGERDLVTYELYRVGDRVVRCGACRAVIKSEFVTDNRCPLCGSTPFLPSPVNISQPNINNRVSTNSLKAFLWFLLLSAVAAYLPFAFPEALDFLYEATLSVGLEATLIYIGVISFVTAIILYNNKTCRRLWQTSDAGGFLVLAPFSAPYLLLAGLWLIMFALALIVLVAIFAIAASNAN